MYEKLTGYLGLLEKETTFGIWGGPGSFIVGYGPLEEQIHETIYNLWQNHPAIRTGKQYGEILKENHLRWDMESMTKADVSSMDGVSVLALLIGAVRAERFCDGALLEFYENGSMVRWLSRLKEIDEENAGK